ncbi:MAG: hypothetical protein ACJAS1_000640 [Oleiphilaceae bacterium]
MARAKDSLLPISTLLINPKKDSFGAWSDEPLFQQEYSARQSVIIRNKATVDKALAILVLL